MSAVRNNFQKRAATTGLSWPMSIETQLKIWFLQIHPLQLLRSLKNWVQDQNQPFTGRLLNLALHIKKNVTSQWTGTGRYKNRSPGMGKMGENMRYQPACLYWRISSSNKYGSSIWARHERRKMLRFRKRLMADHHNAFIGASGWHNAVHGFWRSSQQDHIWLIYD